MEQKTRESRTRLVFFDNLRYLMVLLVLVFHSGASYGSIVAFWPYHDPNPTELVDLLMMILDVFMMSILFFISGYFALSSLQKRGGRRFLASKFKRLGIPWLLVTILVLPVLDYIHYYSQSIDQGLSPRTYGTHWWLSVKKFAELHTGPLGMSQYLDMTQQFYQRYVWFLSLLLLFYVVFWLFYEARNKWGRGSARPVQEEPTSNRSVYGALAVVGVLNVLLFALVKFTLSSPADLFDFVWRSLANLVQCEVAKLAFYVPYFCLGIYAYSRKWFTGRADFGRPWVWGLICFTLTAANMLVGRSISRAVEPSIGVQFAFIVLYPLWTLSFLGLFTAFASRRWNRSTSLGAELAAHSYTVYLVHYVFVMTLPLLLSAWGPGPALIKFAVVALATLLGSLSISKYLIKPYPRLVGLGLVGLNIVLAVTTFL
jgi:peptidoglycan/LPS O-acetylase OafA/YrhL